MRMADFTDDELALFAHAAGRIAARRRTVLYGQGDIDPSIYYLVSGRVKISRAVASSPRGGAGPCRGCRELTLHYVRKGQLFGELALVDDAPRETRAEVVDDAVLLVIRTEAFERLASLRPALALKVIRILGRRQRELEAKMEALLFQGVPSRLAGLLLRLAAEYGVDDSRGTLLATRFTHRELASLIGACRETVSQTLIEFARRNLVTKEGRRLILKREALGRIA